MAAATIHRGLQADLAHTLQHADEEGVYSDDDAGVQRFGTVLADLSAEVLGQPDLLVREAEPVLGRDLLEPQQQPAVLGQEPVALPDAGEPNERVAPIADMLGIAEAWQR
jgi:hypothetical protein